MKLTEDLRAWLQDTGACRYPNIAWRHLHLAQEGLSLVRPSLNPAINRQNAEMMQVVEDAVVSMVASASAVETHVLYAAFRVHGEIMAHYDNELAKRFSEQFVLKKCGSIEKLDEYVQRTRGPEEDHPTEPLGGIWVKGMKQLVTFAGRLFRAIETEPDWADDNELHKLRIRRNILVHRTVRLLPPAAGKGLPQRADGQERRTVMSLMEDLGGNEQGTVRDVEELVGEAENHFRLMVTCCKECLQSAAKKAWTSETDETVQRVLKAFRLCQPEAQGRGIP